MRKNIGLLILTLLSSYSLFAQQMPLEPAPGSFINGVRPEQGAHRAEAVIWSEDFANGIPESWTQVADPNGAFFEYRGPMTNPSNLIGTRGSCVNVNNPIGEPIESPTADNGFIIFDSNFWDDNIGPCGNFGVGEFPGPHFTMLTTDYIDLTGYTSLGMRLNQYMKNYLAQTRIEYSINDGEWAVLWSNTVPQFSGETEKNAFVRFNVSDAIADQANVRLRFVFDGNYYFWMIDDIAIFEIFENNLVIDQTNYGNYIPFNPLGSGYQDLEYAVYPSAMAPNLHFQAQTYNWGSAQQTDARLYTDVVNDLTGDTIYTANSTALTLAPDDGTNFTAPTFQMDGSLAPYSIHYYVEGNQEDEFPQANRVIRNFEVTDYIYARDRQETEGIFVPSPGLFGTQYEVGNFYQITAEDQVAQSISIGVGVGTNPNASVYGRIYKIGLQGGGVTAEIVAETSEYPINQWAFNNVGDNRVMTIDLEEPVLLDKDSAYLVMAGAPGGAGSVLFPVSGNSPDFSSMARFYPSSWFFFVRTPLVRVNFGIVENVQEKATADLAFKCFPNPASELLNLRFELPESAATTLLIYDQTGRIVHTEQFGRLNTGEQRRTVDVSRLANGWYVASLQTPTQTKNEMVVIRR
ncbi:MAG: T9SS type A sorting domain-containing protein [Flavobacteriales bacterium]